MESRDRLANLGLLAAGGVVFILVALVFTTPRSDHRPGCRLCWGRSSSAWRWASWRHRSSGSCVFGRHRRIAYRGDWPRAIRRGAWVCLVTALFVVLRLIQVFQPPIALFVLAIVVVAEATLSAER